MATKLFAFAMIAIIALLVLAALGVFAGKVGLFFTLMLVAALIPMLIAAYAALKLRSKKRDDVDRSRGSVLKHVWEEQQHREW
ncbi:MAG: hypothetical protein Q8922_03660 [Bacteroidota bacterium]|nr:hypothetical protein [Bacteroidota bacterium]MDP4233389.1 hypothetical protein [Bacteroidota bacterium]MDP4242255.1 hypothetical protein [Bacteroidota bacterium]MDP4287011.1 hypothetical protein [Bacteroidota bacterium]